MLLLGRESAGVPRAVYDVADATVRIPMRADLRSLNVAVAAGIVLAEALRQRGYTTAGFVSTTVLDRRLGLGRGFDLYYEPYTQQRRGNLTLALVSDWLNRNPLEPFFLFVHLYDPHQPYSPPPPFDALEGLNVDVAAVDQLLASLGPGKSGAVSADAVLRADRAALPAVGAVARARYRGEIAFVDAQLARLRALLEARGLLDRTLVVFTADHGENFLDRGPSLAFDHAGLQRSGGDVIKYEQWTGTGYQEVVDVHRYKVDANGIVNPSTNRHE